MLARPATNSAETPARTGGVIFVVDDEPMIGEIVASILDLEGYQSRVFIDPQKAFAAFMEADPRPKLLMTDYVMGPMNGMELIHRCRTVSPELKTILYSGNVTEDITSIYVFKPDAFVPKPFLPHTLLGVVQSVLGQE